MDFYTIEINLVLDRNTFIFTHAQRNTHVIAAPNHINTRRAAGEQR